VVPVEGLLAGAEAPDDVPPDEVPPDVAPVDDVPVVEPPAGDEALLAPLVVDPVEDPELPPPQAASTAATDKARGNRMALKDLSDKFAPGCSWMEMQVSAERLLSPDQGGPSQLQHAALTNCYRPGLPTELRQNLSGPADVRHVARSALSSFASRETPKRLPRSHRGAAGR